MYHKKHPRKDKGQRIHFKRRLFERYGLIIDRAGIEEISGMIKNGKSNIVKKSTNRISIHAVVYQGKELNVAYDKTRGQVVSALPIHNEEKNKSQEHAAVFRRRLQLVL